MSQMTLKGALATVTAGLVLGAGGTPAASAHGPAPHGQKPGLAKRAVDIKERRLRAIETRTLGRKHAAEHAGQRAVWRNPRARAKLRRAARSARSGRLRARASAVPSQDGQWGAPFSIPSVGIHAAMLATGKVMWFHRPQTAAGKSQITLWDPATGSTKQVDPPSLNGRPANFFCGAQSLLADGRLLVTGGEIAKFTSTTTDKGLNTVYTFNPFDETWTRQPDMAEGRWYPTQVLLPDGRTLIMSGKDSSGTPGAPYNNDIEVFTPSPDLNGVGTVSLLGRRGGAGQPPAGSLYPHMFAMPSGRTMVAGPASVDSWFLGGLGSGLDYSWTDAPDPARHSGGNGVLLPSDTPGAAKVALIAGGGPATALNQVFDEVNPAAGWVTAPPLNVARTYQNTVVLPDGSMVAVGGGTNAGSNSAFVPDNLDVELYDPTDRTWRRGAPRPKGAPTTRPPCSFPTGAWSPPETTPTAATTPTPPRSTALPTSSRGSGPRSRRLRPPSAMARA